MSYPKVQQASLLRSVLGLMVGDALGLPYEGMSANRTKEVFR